MEVEVTLYSSSIAISLQKVQDILREILQLQATSSQDDGSSIEVCKERERG